MEVLTWTGSSFLLQEGRALGNGLGGRQPLQLGLSLGQDGSHGTVRVLGVTVRNLQRIICQVSVGILGGWLDPSFGVSVAAPCLLVSLPQPGNPAG